MVDLNATRCRSVPRVFRSRFLPLSEPSAVADELFLRSADPSATADGSDNVRQERAKNRPEGPALPRQPRADGSAFQGGLKPLRLGLASLPEFPATMGRTGRNGDCSCYSVTDGFAAGVTQHAPGSPGVESRGFPFRDTLGIEAQLRLSKPYCGSVNKNGTTSRPYALNALRIMWVAIQSKD